MTADTIGARAGYTNMVELGDVNGDGLVDMFFAEGGEYDFAGSPLVSGAYLGQADGTWTDASPSVFGDLELLTRVIRVVDLDANGTLDLFLGTTYVQQSHLLLGDGNGAFSDVTATNLPDQLLSVGDAEAGDVDGDGDLDIVLIDWGPDGPAGGEGGAVHLWLNEGAAQFVEASEGHMPPTLAKFSWDIELIDVDNDWDLDVAVSCKLCTGGVLFENDGAGTFTDVTAGRLPQFANNYDYAPIDLDADGYLDLVTINDGIPTQYGLTEHILRNDGTGTFVDVTTEWWPRAANPGWDDNGVYALDIDSDGDADYVVGSLDGPDRLLVNDGSGLMALETDVFPEPMSRGTLGFAFADLNGDGRIDAVESQGEVPGSFDERVYFATDAVPADTAPPHIRAEIAGTTVMARVHDNLIQYRPHDWQSIVARWDGGEVTMTWYGEQLFRGVVPEGAAGVEVCAVDAAGNEACSG